MAHLNETAAQNVFRFIKTHHKMYGKKEESEDKLTLSCLQKLTNPQKKCHKDSSSGNVS